MLFNSWSFLVFFLPFTLSALWLNQIFSRPLSNLGILLACSFLFYGVWHPPYLLLLLCSIATNYLFARFTNASLQEVKNTLVPKLSVACSILFNICLLGYYKYCNFFIETANVFSNDSIPLMEIVLPLAISFYTLQQISYQVDVYKGKHSPGSFLHYAFFVAFFPQLIAGPIVRYQQILPYIQSFDKFRLNAKSFAEGLALFQFGLVKKVLIADTLSRFVDPTYAQAAAGEGITIVQSFFSSYFYCLQLYFDFSAYSTMAIGLAWMFGFKLPLNFIAPFRACSPRELWQRWHLTLTNFFRDYVYIPLNKKRVIRGVYRRPGHTWNVLALMVLFLLSGLWHGANWTFMIWGALHGFAFVLHEYWGRMTRTAKKIKANVFYRFSAGMLFLFFCMTTIVFFRAPDLDVVDRILNPILYNNWQDVFQAAGAYLASSKIGFLAFDGLYAFIFLCALVAGSLLLCHVLPTAEEMFQGIMDFPELRTHKNSFFHIQWSTNGLFLAVQTLLFLTCLFLLSENNPFIYFQF